MTIHVTDADEPPAAMDVYGYDVDDYTENDDCRGESTLDGDVDPEERLPGSSGRC